jgi:hypothetical protein
MVISQRPLLKPSRILPLIRIVRSLQKCQSIDHHNYTLNFIDTEEHWQRLDAGFIAFLIQFKIAVVSDLDGELPDESGKIKLQSFYSGKVIPQVTERPIEWHPKIYLDYPDFQQVIKYYQELQDFWFDTTTGMYRSPFEKFQNSSSRGSTPTIVEDNEANDDDREQGEDIIENEKIFKDINKIIDSHLTVEMEQSDFRCITDILKMTTFKAKFTKHPHDEIMDQRTLLATRLLHYDTDHQIGLFYRREITGDKLFWRRSIFGKNVKYDLKNNSATPLNVNSAKLIWQVVPKEIKVKFGNEYIENLQDLVWDPLSNEYY